MKKTLFAISLWSLSLLLCACSSSESTTADNSRSEDSQKKETNEGHPEFKNQSGPISFDDFELTYTEKDTGTGYTGVYVSLTNHSDFTILYPYIEYELKPGVTSEDVQAVMPNSLRFDPETNEQMGGICTNSAKPYVKPSESSEEMVIIIYTEEYERPEGYSVIYAPITQKILDLLEVTEVRGTPIDGGKMKKTVQLQPGDAVPAESLEDADSLFNEVVEGGKDLIIVPDRVSFYSTYEYYFDRFHGYGFDFYDVEQTAMDKCIEDYKEKYPPMFPDRSDDFFLGQSGVYMFEGLDSEGHTLHLEWSKEYHTISGSVTAD